MVQRGETVRRDPGATTVRQPAAASHLRPHSMRSPTALCGRVTVTHNHDEERP